MESTKTFVEHPSGKLAVTVHAPRSLREEEAAYFHGINLDTELCLTTEWLLCN